MFLVFSIVSLSIFVTFITLGIVFSKTLYKSKRLFNFFIFMFAGVFLSAFCLILPMYLYHLEGESANVIKSIFYSIHNSLRLFVLDGDFELLLLVTENISEPTKSFYQVLSGIIFTICPFFTFTAVLSLISEFNGQVKLFFTFKKKIYLFSELNEKSLALASSISSKNKKAKIIFTNFDNENSNANSELVKKAKELDSIIFKKNIQLVKVNHFLFKTVKEINFYLISENDLQNWKSAEIINNKYLNCKKDYIHIFVVSSNINGEARIGSFKIGNATFRRLDICRNSIYSFLLDNGNVLFDRAFDKEGKPNKQIHALVYGFNSYSQMMVRSLCWFCQMDNFDLTIDVYEESIEKVEDFKSSYPELIELNNQFDSMGEARYSLNFFTSENFSNKTQLNNLIVKNGEISFAFVDFAEEDETLKECINLKILFDRNNWKPYLLSAIDKANLFFENNVSVILGDDKFSYDINFLPITESLSRIEEFESQSLEKHLAWGEKGNFNINEYGFLSSLASSIHKKYKIHCGMLPNEYVSEDLTTRQVLWDKMSDAQKESVLKCEHRRWNAYMRSEGYIYSEKRNKLAKTHYDLVDFDKLSEAEKQKDKAY